jgi:DNA mismatch repair protein MutS2
MVNNFSVGDRVLVAGINQQGCIVAIDRGWAIVGFEFVKLKVSVDRLSPIEYSSLSSAPSHRISHISHKATTGLSNFQLDSFLKFSPTIDLHGLRVDAALQQLDHWIDRAIVAGHNQLKIVHGKGQGILRRHIHDYLSRHDAVKKIIQDHNRPGGWGVTWVEL